MLSLSPLLSSSTKPFDPKQVGLAYQSIHWTHPKHGKNPTILKLIKRYVFVEILEGCYVVRGRLSVPCTCMAWTSEQKVEWAV